MNVLVTLKGKGLIRFSARHGTKPGNPFDWLKVPNLRFYESDTTQGLARVRVHARYRSQRTHTVQFVVDTNVTLPDT